MLSNLPQPIHYFSSNEPLLKAITLLLYMIKPSISIVYVKIN